METTTNSAAAPLFYQRPVLLNRQQHGNLKLKLPDSLAFTAQASLIPLLAAEFNEAAREYSIVFMRPSSGEDPVPVVLTGPPRGKNIYLDAAGKWNARYVPAYVRRYPFVFAETGGDQLAVCIDEACPELSVSDGAPLFESNGEPTPMLQKILGRLGEYQRQTQITRDFMKRLAAAGLLVQADGKIDMDDGRSLALSGFLMVDEARFKALPEATLKEWFASGELGLVYAHLMSLGNLVELLRRQTQAPPAIQQSASAPQHTASSSDTGKTR